MGPRGSARPRLGCDVFEAMGELRPAQLGFALLPDAVSGLRLTEQRELVRGFDERATGALRCTVCERGGDVHRQVGAQRPEALVRDAP